MVNSTRHLLVLALSLLLIPRGQVLAQGSKVRAYVLDGDAYREQELYFQASEFYRKALRLSPDHLYAAYQLAECQRLQFNYETAEQYYGRVYHADQAKYPQALFYLALMKKMNGKYREAILHFRQYLEQSASARRKSAPVDEELRQRATLEKEGCEMALLQKRSLHRDFVFQRLDNSLNTAYNDYAPTIYLDDSLLLIASGRLPSKSAATEAKFGEALNDFYLFRLTPAGWQPTQESEGLRSLNTNGSEGSGSFNAARTKFYFTQCSENAGPEKPSNCRIYVTTLKNGKWETPQLLNANINLPQYEARHPAVSPDGDSLYFASNRPGGKGLNDIWLSISTGHDDWTPPLNLGSAVNTAGQELSPFFDAGENTLFFSSDGQQGLGGLDVFMLKSGAVAGQEKPINLGEPFNSSGDDCFFTTGQQTGYLASNRQGGAGKFDIYTFHLKSRATVVANLKRSSRQRQPEYLQDFQLTHLPAEDQLRIDQHIHRRAAAKVYQVQLPQDPEEEFWYQSLSTQEKQQIERAVEKRIAQWQEDPAIDLVKQDEFDYQQLPLEEKTRIDRMATTYRKAGTLQQPAVLSPEDNRYYNQLSEDDRKKTDRLIISRMATAQPPSRPDSALAANSFNYDRLPEAEKQRIDRIVAARKMAAQKGTDVELSPDDTRFYEHLSSEEKLKIDEILAQRTRRVPERQASEKESPADAFSPAAAPAFEYGYLPTENKTQITGNPRAPRVKSLHGTDLSTADVIPEQYQRLTIRGRLTQTSSGQPAADVAILLVDEHGRVVKVTTTNSDGQFQYVHLPLDHSYRVVVQEPGTRLTRQSEYQLQDLELLGFESPDGDVRFENIYFDFNQYTLRPEAAAALDDLALLCLANPRQQVEINAFTDDIGSLSYNLELSQKRGTAVMTYLMHKGVRHTSLVMNAMGQSRPVTTNDTPLGRQLNRRVEFTLRGSYGYESRVRTYILKVGISIADLARALNCTTDELRQLNQLASDRLEAFHPIRVRTTHRVSPAIFFLE